VKERLREFQQRFTGVIFRHAQEAQDLGQLPAGEDVTLLVFELNGIILAANANFVMTDDPAVLDMGRRAVRRRLAVDLDSAPAR
jgi:hypothetical protein